MDLHVPVPHSGDGGYELSDLPALDLEFPVEPDDKSSDDIVNSPGVEAPHPPGGMTLATAELDPGAGLAPVSQGVAPTETPQPAEAGPKLRRKKRAVKRRWDKPAWVVSAMIHAGLLVSLTAMATGPGAVARPLKDLDSALVSNPGAADEMTKIYADPADMPRTELNGDTDSTTEGAGVGFAPSIGSKPSNTPAVARTGKPVNEKTSLPTIPTIVAPSGLASTGVKLNRDFGGGGMIGGDVTFAAGEVGVALDQIAREILRHLTQHKVTVVWMFDESESMRDDQKEIRKKFDRVVNELKVNTPDEPAAKPKKSKSSGPPLGHAIVGFGDDVHFELEKPTADIELIGRAIDRLRIDSTGKENTMSAVAKVIAHYGNLVSDERKLLIVLVTDESGDDGEFVEEARQASTNRDVPIYIIGRQSLFGTDHLTIEYRDPVTSDVFWVGIRRGPETADVEALQVDGIHRRWDELPSGFAPYELARIAKESGGIYFTLPSEEGLRIKKREKAYSINTLKEYVPDYESRVSYFDRRAKSEFRRTLFEVIQETKTYQFRHHFPIFPEQLIPAIEQELPVVTLRLNALIKIEERLRQLEKLRNREPEKRWQAAYDLMLAQVVAYQIKAFEYRANLEEMYKNPPKPNQMPTETLFVDWTLDHSHDMKAPKEKTEKVYKEAKRLFDLVVERHPSTPWGDLAQDEINRGFSVKRNEWHHRHSTRYEERAKLVPKF